jgi:hypothetical protein
MTPRLDSALGTMASQFGGSFRSRIEQVFVARPTGVERADAINIRIPIERAQEEASGRQSA